jgi:predicted O-methyltransferase YrrM
MNLDHFTDALHDRFGSDPYRADAPRHGLDEVVAAVEGMSTTHSLSVLQEAVACLGPDEVYLEVGSYRGRSLVGALLAAPSARGFGIENFGEFGDDARVAAFELRANLERFGVSDRATVLHGDAFRLLPSLHLSGPVGVYLYDGVHSAFGQYAGLGLAEHLLADHAVVVVDDASWPQVARATDAYVARHPGYTLLAAYEARQQDDPMWCNGLRVYRWDRPLGARASSGWDVRGRAVLQSRVTGPARTIAWSALGDRPGALEALRRIVVRGGTTVVTRDDASGPAS